MRLKCARLQWPGGAVHTTLIHTIYMTDTSHATVTEHQIVKAMQYFEKKFIAGFGPLDGVNLPAEVSQLADVLGVFWFERTKTAAIALDSKVAALLIESGQLPSQQ